MGLYSLVLSVRVKTLNELYETLISEIRRYKPYYPIVGPRQLLTLYFGLCRLLYRLFVFLWFILV